MSLFECKGLCISVSGDLSKGISLCLSMSLYVSMYYVHIYVSVSVLECADLFVEFMYTHEGSVSMCVCFFMSLCPYPCLPLILGSCQSMSALVLSMSLCVTVYYGSVCLCVCLNVSIQEHLCLCLCLSMTGSFCWSRDLCMWVCL